MLKYLNAKTKKGFTLIEVLIAVFLITIGMGGALFLINRIIVFTDITTSRLTAFYLGQEGIEIVKNIRDTNFLKVHRRVAGASWDDGRLRYCAAGCRADYNDTYLTSVDPDRPLRINGGFFSYDSGIDTPFRRKIFIKPTADILKVSVKVTWEERGRTHQVSVQENLHRWWR